MEPLDEPDSPQRELLLRQRRPPQSRSRREQHGAHHRKSTSEVVHDREDVPIVNTSVADLMSDDEEADDVAARAVPMDRATPAENIAHAAPAAAAATAAHATHATHGTHHRGQRPKSDSIPRKSLDAAAKPPRATSTSSTTQASGSSSACLAPPASPASPKQQGASAPAAAPAPVVLEMPESLLPAPTSTSLTAALEDVTVTLASADLAPADLSTVERAGPAPVAALYAAAAETEPQLGAPPPLAGHAEPLAPEHDVAALRATIASLRAELTREQALREQLERQARLQTRGDNDSFMELATTNALLLERISALEASKQQLENLVVTSQERIVSLRRELLQQQQQQRGDMRVDSGGQHTPGAPEPGGALGAIAVDHVGRRVARDADSPNHSWDAKTASTIRTAPRRSRGACCVIH